MNSPPSIMAHRRNLHIEEVKEEDEGYDYKDEQSLLTSFSQMPFPSGGPRMALLDTCQTHLPGTSQGDSVSEPPNRRQFERILSRFSADINTREQELRLLLGHRSSSGSSSSVTIGEINKSRDIARACRRERDQCRQKMIIYQRDIDELKKVLAVKRDEISQVEEKYLFIKNEQKLAAQLKRYETAYDNKQFTNIREETAIVQQIDKLRRNQKHLKKWKVHCEECDSLEEQLKTLRTQTQDCYRKIKETRVNEDAHKKQYREGGQRVSTLRKELDEMYDQKRRLMQDYDKEKRQFMDWECSNSSSVIAGNPTGGGKRQTMHRSKVKRKTSAYGGFDGAGRYDVKEKSDSDSDGGGDFELFVEEKRTCRNLISYLQRIVPPSALCGTPSTGSYESEPQSMSPSNHTSLSNTSSLADEQHPADDGTANLTVLRKDACDECTAGTGNVWTTAEAHGRRKPVRKEKGRKANQPITYDPQTLNRFHMIDVKPPLSVSDAPAAIDNLKEKLKYYEDQTRVPSDTSASYWYDTFGIRLGTDRMISSESEMTTDSARFSYVTPSDVDADDNRSCSGVLSPKCRHPVILSHTAPEPPSLLIFQHDQGEPDLASVTTPLANISAAEMAFGAMGDRKESTEGPKVVEEDAIPFAGVPTYDEGFADVVSKESSTGDPVTGENGVKASQIQMRLGKLAVQHEDEEGTK